MENPFTASRTFRSFGPNMTPRWIVQLDADAAEIMGETKMRYVFDSESGAAKFAATLQGNFDAAFADACGV